MVYSSPLTRRRVFLDFIRHKLAAFLNFSQSQLWSGSRSLMLSIVSSIWLLEATYLYHLLFHKFIIMVLFTLIDIPYYLSLGFNFYRLQYELVIDSFSEQTRGISSSRLSSRQFCTYGQPFWGRGFSYSKQIKVGDIESRHPSSSYGLRRVLVNHIVLDA